MSKNRFYWTLPLVLAGLTARAQGTSPGLPEMTIDLPRPDQPTNSMSPADPSTNSVASQDRSINPMPPDPSTDPVPAQATHSQAREDQLDRIYLDSTNRLTLSVRFGLNISAKFKGIGSTFTSGSIYGRSRTTPDGDMYNFDNGYVLTDISGNALGYTSYWGYDNASQVNAAGFPANTIEFDQTTAAGIPSSGSGKDMPPGVELTYDHQLGVKEEWRHMRYGWEGAANFMKFSMANNSSATVNLVTTTTAYSYQAGDTPPGAPFQGTFSGFGYMFLQVPPTYPTTGGPTTITPGATFVSHDKFDADLWGFRFGPYVEWPLSKRIDLRLGGGLAAGLVYGRANWNETLTPPLSAPIAAAGGGNAFDFLWGAYLNVDATYRFNERWSIDAGAQFQDIGKYSHNFQGRRVELGLDQSIFLQAGVTYTF